MALWLVVHQPNDGCSEEGTPASPSRIAILEASDAAAALALAIQLAYPEEPPWRPKGIRPSRRDDEELHKQAARRAAEFDIVPVGEHGEFVTV